MRRRYMEDNPVAIAHSAPRILAIRSPRTCGRQIKLVEHLCMLMQSRVAYARCNQQFRHTGTITVAALVADFLKAKIRDGSRLSVVSAYFTIYAYEALKDHLDQIEHLDFLFGEPRFISSLDPDKTEKKAFILDGNGLHLANRLQQKRVARECAEWIREKVDIRSVRHAQLLHGKMYHIANAGVEEAILGSSNFTVRGLGLGAGNNNIELNLEVDSNRDRRDLKAWFDELWNDHRRLVEDVKQEVLLYLDQLYQNHAPEFIYYKTLFHVFENFLADQEKGGLLDQNIKIVDTGIWQALFEFQRDGVKGAINKILKHNGCILADSVGLGKTFEALAVIKYFELKNERVLVLCPKKLRENWTVYRHNDALNPFIDDRFRLRCPLPHRPEPRRRQVRRHRSCHVQLGQLRSRRH